MQQYETAVQRLLKLHVRHTGLISPLVADKMEVESMTIMLFRALINIPRSTDMISHMHTWYLFLLIDIINPRLKLSSEPSQ